LKLLKKLVKSRKSLKRRKNDFMRILAIGDFHGKVPRNLKKFVKRNRIDLIICTGDICYANRIQWKYWKRLKNESLIDILGKRKLKKLILNKLKKSKKVLKFFRQIEIPLILVYGNSDITNDNIKHYVKHYGVKVKGIEKIIKQNKNVKALKCRKIKFNDLVILGHSGYRNYKSKKEKFDKFSNKWKKDLKRLAKYAKGDFIFLTHDVPLGKLDKIRNIKSPLNGKHIGDEFYLRFIKKYQPFLHVCGHMHENQGKAKIGKTIVVNPGYGRIGEAAIIDLDKNDIKFVKI